LDQRDSRARGALGARSRLLTVTRLLLAFEDWRAEVAPHIGGSILSLSRGAQSILRPTSQDALTSGSVRRTACYPLVPYANRIARGRFCWAGVEYALPENFPGSAHPVHGVGWRRPWRVVSVDAHSCCLRLEHRPSSVAVQDWPFAFDVEQTISLRADGMMIDLSVVNAGEFPAPLGLGLHPLFVRRGSERIRFTAAGAWRNGPDMLRSAPISGGLWNHRAGQPVGAQALDNDFFGWDGAARIGSGQAPAIRITASRIFSVLRVFTPRQQDFFAIEPVSHLTDAINGTSGSGASMFIAEPGAQLAGTVWIGADSSS
jgi:aldose 1-epimerase